MPPYYPRRRSFKSDQFLSGLREIGLYLGRSPTATANLITRWGLPAGKGPDKRWVITKRAVDTWLARIGGLVVEYRRDTVGSRALAQAKADSARQGTIRTGSPGTTGEQALTRSTPELRRKVARQVGTLPLDIGKISRL